MEFTGILAQIRHERFFADNENFYVFSLLKSREWPWKSTWAAYDSLFLKLIFIGV